jgi:hypothetical protein
LIENICVLKRNIVDLVPWFSNPKTLVILANFVLRLIAGEISSQTEINHAVGFIVKSVIGIGHV